MKALARLKGNSQTLAKFNAFMKFPETPVASNFTYGVQSLYQGLQTTNTGVQSSVSLWTHSRSIPCVILRRSSGFLQGSILVYPCPWIFNIEREFLNFAPCKINGILSYFLVAWLGWVEDYVVSRGFSHVNRPFSPCHSHALTKMV